jgi:hypothetical protein
MLSKGEWHTMWKKNLPLAIVTGVMLLLAILITP